MAKPKDPKKPKKPKKGAMAIRFVDAGGNDANDGLDNSGAALAGADWTEATFTLTEAAHGYTFATGDVIYLSAGTGVTVGLYEVASSTSSTIVLVDTSTLLDVGNASDVAAGDLSNSDITSSDGPDLTGDAAMNAVAAGDTVYMRSDKTYSELLTIDTVGTTTSAIRFVGYTTTLDDDGQAEIAAADTRTNCIADSLGGVGFYYTFENFKFTQGTGDCVNISGNAVHWRNCEFTGAAADGLASSGNGMVCESCIFFDNGAKGVLHVSQISIGEENNLAIWVYGEKQGLEWHQEHPNYLYVKSLDGPRQVWQRGNDYVGVKSPAAGRATRIPSGHPEAFLEAFANNYCNFADTLRARLAGEKPDPLALDFPGVDDGLRGMIFIETVLESARSEQKWTPMKA